MNDEQLDALLAAAARATDADVARWDLMAPEDQMREAIMSSEPTATDVAEPPVAPESAVDPAGNDDDELTPFTLTRARPGRRHRRRRVAAAGAAGLAVTAALAVVAVWVAARPQGGQYAVAPPATGRSAPQLLVDLPGWQITYVDIDTARGGQVTMSDGASSLEISWYDQGSYEYMVEDRQDVGPAEAITVLGRPADLFVYTQPGPPGGGSPNDPSTVSPEHAALGDFTTLWRDAEGGVQARGSFPSEESYRAALAALVEVDRDTWFAAMAPSVVLPADRETAVAGMLADVPLPPAFRLSALDEDDPQPITRYNLGADVTVQVTCGWIEAWVDATDSGDDAAAQRAVDAMATSHDWAILLEMDAEGAFPISIWELADAMPTDARYGPGEGFAIGETYRQGLGCDPNSPAGF